MGYRAWSDEGKWSRLYDRCVRCKTSERRHRARGLCWKCWDADDRLWKKTRKTTARV